MPLTINGEVQTPLTLSYDDLTALADVQVSDVSRLVPGRKGDAVSLAGLLKLAAAKSEAKFLVLHASRDDFHASIPLDAVRDSGLVLYRLEGKPLPESAGGPFRFLIPNVAACKTHEIDECANVKYVDRLELRATPGHDNRPKDEREHQSLHQQQQPQQTQRQETKSSQPQQQQQQ